MFQNYKSTGQISKVWVKLLTLNRFGFGHMFWFHTDELNAVAYCKSFEFFRVCSSGNLTPPQSAHEQEVNGSRYCWEAAAKAVQQVHTSTGTEGLTECVEDLLTQIWSYSAKIPPLFSQL